MSCVIDTKDKQVPVCNACSRRVVVCLKGSMTARKKKKTKTDGGLNDEAQCDQRDTSITVGADKGRHEESRTHMQTQNTNTAHLVECCGASWE